MNADAEVGHVNDACTTAVIGDIHPSKQFRTQAYDPSIFDQWKAFKAPVVYTPGDNEWADRHKAKEGGGTYNAVTGQIDYIVDYAGGDPMASLALVRSMFFGDRTHAFGGQLAVHSQAMEYDKAYATDRTYAENVWFEKSGVLFVTLNIPGGSNNDTDPWYGAPSMSPVERAEVAHRAAANLRWLDTAFARAKAAGNVAVVINEQAAKTADFGKPVLLVNGDLHLYRSDNPLKKGQPRMIETGTGTATEARSATSLQSTVGNPPDPYDTQPNGYDVSDFHRIVVHGSLLPLEKIKLRVDPAVNAPASATGFGPFSWTRVQP